jgi:hypothetical protein
MPKYLIKANYTAEGMKGLQKDKASGREKAVATACKAVGGKLDAIPLGIELNRLPVPSVLLLRADRQWCATSAHGFPAG